MGAIGKRAAEEIRTRCAAKDIFYTTELGWLGLQSQRIYKWEKGVADPNAETLARMLDAGYDIKYILLGVRS